MIFTLLSMGLFLVVITVLIAWLVLLICTSAIIFAQISLSLILAFVLSQCNLVLVPGGGFLNYLAFAVIILTVVFGVTTLFPRVGTALNFLCTILVSNVSVYIMCIMFGGIISAIVKSDFELNLGYELLVKFICAGMAIYGMVSQSRAPYDSSKYIIVRAIERFVASIMYAVGLLFLFISLGGNWHLHALVGILLFIVFVVGAYIADVRLFGKGIFHLNDNGQGNIMPK
ncbi:MAG: hypothetical protein MJ114_01615 [Acetatifactor sp.]|nr:hypothetical protein [Acetatifactor sp.]